MNRWAGSAAIAAAAAAAAVLGAAQARAADPYPLRTITFIVPVTHGTGQDIIARILALRLTERWGQSVIVDNRPGASGNIGTELVARASPDGHTLLVTATSFVTNTAINRNVRYDPVKSFVPVSLLATGTMSLLVSAETPAASVRELVALAKKNPGRLNYGSAGNGTPQHLSMELFKLDTGTDLTHVPYKNSASLVNDAVGGHVNVLCIPIHTALPHVQQGKLRMLAVLAAERAAVLPSVPTMREAGFPSVQVANWYGMLAPAGIPHEIVGKLNAEIHELLARAEIRDLLAKQGLQPVAGPPSRLAELIQSELARWPRVVAAAGIRAD